MKLLTRLLLLPLLWLSLTLPHSGDSGSQPFHPPIAKLAGDPDNRFGSSCELQSEPICRQQPRVDTALHAATKTRQQPGSTGNDARVLSAKGLVHAPVKPWLGVKPIKIYL